ncbi:uncharacterized protein si:dkeyp-84f3.9 [Anguilla anguilla]|uniref:uncharacterized protein si:dkeyp-84f3.9 n=1 Tax=Anguilla anguilla TaxID=7936 RepID=UPI0015B2DB70|nr:uncharacterized protein si:dkeyp-84f3.9 [Anguilla anguilla]
MMFEEEDVDHQTGNDNEEYGMNSGGRTQGEIGGLPVGDVTPAAVVAALSEYLPHSKDQSQKNRRGRPKKILQLKEGNQREKNDLEAVLHGGPGNLKTHSTSCQQQSTDLDRAFENGSPFDQVPEGISNQEHGFALSSTKKHRDIFTCTVAGEQQVSPESSGTVATIQDDFPPFSGSRYNKVKSNTETQSHPGATERLHRKPPDKYPGGGEGRIVVAQMPWISSLAEQDDVKGENDARLHPSGRLSQNSWKNCQGQGKDRGIAIEEQEKVKMAESVILTKTPARTGELTDKFRDCQSSSVIPSVSQSEMFQSAGKAVKELVHAGVPHEPKVKRGQKDGPPKTNLHSKTQVRRTVSGSHELGNYLEENRTCRKRSSSSSDQSKEKLRKCKMKESDKSLESVRMDTTVKKASSKADVRLVDTNVGQMQPSRSLSSTGPDPVNPANEKPKNKMGRPQKKCEYIVTKKTIGILGADCSASVKECSQKALSPKDFSDKKTLETTVCVRKKKRGRGKYIRKPVCIIPPQEQVVGMAIEGTAETLSSSRKPHSVQEVIGGKQVKGPECKARALLDLKTTTAPTPVGCSPHEQQKRGRRKKIICLTEKTSNSFEPQNCSVSQKVMLPPSKIKTELKGMAIMSTTDRKGKGTVKEKTEVVSQHGDGGSIAVGSRNRAADEKLKRKIGRPFKKKTLIKMAKQLALAQIRTANATDIFERNQPENIPLHHPQIYKLKRERKKVELYSPVSPLRRYSRACKLNANYLDEKQEHHPASSHKPLLSSVSSVTVAHLDSGKTVSRSSAVHSKKDSETTKSEGHDCVKVTWKKAKHLKNKRKSQVNIKVEEIQPSVFTEFSKIQNPSAFQERLPMLSKETLTSSESVSTEKIPLKNWKMRSKARKTDQLRSSTESGQSLSTQSRHQIHNDSAAAKDTVPLLIPKEEIEETPNAAATENKVVSHKDTRTVTMKKVRRKGRMSQKKVVAKIKYEPTVDAALSNVSASKNKYESHSKSLPTTQSLIESNLSGDNGSRRRGRPCKTKAMIPTVKSSEEVKKEMVDYESLTDQSCPLKPPGKVMSCLNISGESEMKRPRKVDRRRKRFRRQKALELKASSEVLLNPSEPVGKFTSQIDHRENVHYISQTHSNKRKLEADDQLFNDSNSFTKRPRKAFGSRKRRRRKRSWWDDRGKDKDVLTEKYPDSLLKPSLPSVEGKAEVAVVVKTDFDVKRTTNQESIHSYQHKMQNANKLPSHTRAVAQRSGTDRISGEVEFSDQINLSTEEKNRPTEKSCGYQGHSEPLKNAFLNETEGVLFHDISISENQRWVSNPENLNDQNLAVNNSGPLAESCKGTVGLVTDELQEKQVSNETVTSSSHALKNEVNVLETDSPKPDELLKEDITRQRSGRSKNEDQQKQVVTNEKNISRDGSVMLIPKETDQVETNVEMCVSSESKTLNPTNLRPSKTLDEEYSLSDVFPNAPDVEINQAMFLQQNVSIQDLPPDKKGWENYQDGVEQSDQELEEEGCIEEDAVESMAEELPLSIHSKIRGPGRPPKDKEKKPIECQICGRAFHHISAYVIHRRVHTGERPYSCQECGKTFAQLSNLNTHRKTHKLPDDLRRMFSDQEELLVHCQKNAEELNRQRLTRQVSNEEDGEKNQHRSFPCLKDRKPHVCSVCGKGFRYSSMLKIHMRVHSGEKPYSCKICGKSFSQACSVRVHEKIHWSVKPYICNLCGKGFSQLGTLRTHFYSHTGLYKEGGKQVSNKVIFQCRTCNKSFSIWHQYNFHLKSHIDVQFFACDICGQQFRQISDLSFHRQSCGKQTIKDTVHHSFVFDTLQKSQKQKGLPFQPHPIQHSQLQSNHQYQPQGQQQTFFPNYSISQQQVYHLPEHKTFSELMNPQPQRDASQQRKHSSRSKWRQMASPAYSQMIIKSPRKRYHSRHTLSTSAHLDHKFDPRKYLCPRCGRLFRHLGRLRAHMLTHVHGHSYTCGRCGKTLENWNKFWLHQRIHRQKRGRFFCPKCGQGFRFAGMYKQHLQEHKELRVFACSSCPQTFSHRETLKAHQREEHKPHKCNVCGKSFHLQGNLQRHNLVHRHTHPECCPHCSLLFPNISGLQDHMITHKSPTGPLLDVSAQQNLLPYQCGECEASFKNLDLLFRHQLCHSPPRDRKPWRNGEIVGLQNKGLHVFTSLDDTSVYPSSSSSDPQVSALYTDPSSHQQGSRISHTYSPDHSQLASNKPSQSSKFQSLENNTHLPQTLTPCTAVPFSEAQPLSLPQYPQTCNPVQSPSHKQVQTSPKFGKVFTQKPLRTYEKSKRGAPCTPSTSVKPQSEEDSRDSLECVECGAQFNLVPELYEHYLQHARGEL